MFAKIKSAYVAVRNTIAKFLSDLLIASDQNARDALVAKDATEARRLKFKSLMQRVGYFVTSFVFGYVTGLTLGFIFSLVFTPVLACVGSIVASVLFIVDTFKVVEKNLIASTYAFRMYGRDTAAYA